MSYHIISPILPVRKVKQRESNLPEFTLVRTELEFEPRSRATESVLQVGHVIKAGPGSDIVSQHSGPRTMIPSCNSSCLVD